MKTYEIALVVFGVGIVGGIANALMSGNTFILPRTDPGPPSSVFMPGLLITGFIGGVASIVSWGLYGASAGSSFDAASPFTVSALAGAILTGFSGARWLTNEVDKKLLTKTASIAAGSDASQGKASEILRSSPLAALNMVRKNAG